MWTEGSRDADDRAEAARIAELARLAVPADELARVAEQLSEVLEFAATLDQLELSDCEPTAFAPAGEALRADAPDGRTLGPSARRQAPRNPSTVLPRAAVVEHLEP